MDSAKAMRHFFGETTEHNAYIVFLHMVDAVAPRQYDGEVNVESHGSLPHLNFGISRAKNSDRCFSRSLSAFTSLS